MDRANSGQNYSHDARLRETFGDISQAGYSDQKYSQGEQRGHGLKNSAPMYQLLLSGVSTSLCRCSSSPASENVFLSQPRSCLQNCTHLYSRLQPDVFP